MKFEKCHEDTASKAAMMVTISKLNTALIPCIQIFVMLRARRRLIGLVSLHIPEGGECFMPGVEDVKALEVIDRYRV